MASEAQKQIDADRAAIVAKLNPGEDLTSPFRKVKKVKKQPIVSSSGNTKATANKALAKQLTKQSFLMDIQGLTQSRDALLAVAGSNVLKQQKELDISLEDAAKRYSSLSSAQRAAAGASGININSQSFLDVYAETANQYTIQTGRLKETTRLNQESLYKESLMKAEEYNIAISSSQLQQRLQDLMLDQ